MTVEQILLEKWRCLRRFSVPSLPPDKQQEVFDFVEFLHRQVSPHKLVKQEQSKLGEKLQQIREKIIASDIALLTDEEIDRELTERRGGYQEPE